MWGAKRGVTMGEWKRWKGTETLHYRYKVWNPANGKGRWGRWKEKGGGIKLKLDIRWAGGNRLVTFET